MLISVGAKCLETGGEVQSGGDCTTAQKTNVKRGVKTFNNEWNLMIQECWHFGFQICFIQIHVSNSRSGIHMDSL